MDNRRLRTQVKVWTIIESWRQESSNDEMLRKQIRTGKKRRLQTVMVYENISLVQTNIDMCGQ